MPTSSNNIHNSNVNTKTEPKPTNGDQEQTNPICIQKDRRSLIGSIEVPIDRVCPDEVTGQVSLDSHSSLADVAGLQSEKKAKKRH